MRVLTTQMDRTSVSVPTAGHLRRRRQVHSHLSMTIQSLHSVLALTEGDTRGVQAAIDALARLRLAVEEGAGLMARVGSMRSKLAEKQAEGERRIKDVNRKLVNTQIEKAEVLGRLDMMRNDLAVAKRQVAQGIFVYEEEDGGWKGGIAEVETKARSVLESLTDVEAELQRVTEEIDQIEEKRKALQERADAVLEEL